MEDPAEQLCRRESPSVKKLTLGVGSKTSPAKGGAGMLYIDDIGFGHPAQ